MDEEPPVRFFSPALWLQRYLRARDYLKEIKPPIEIVADLGCSEGKFVKFLRAIASVRTVYAVDIDRYTLDEEGGRNAEPILFDYMRGRLHGPLDTYLLLGDVTVPDTRFVGIDAVTCIELIEHLPVDQIQPFTDNIFGFMRPGHVIVTTPNREFNEIFADSGRKTLPSGLRHWDHKFEWTRDEFEQWCKSVCSKYPDYSFTTEGIGEPPEGKEHVGCGSQMAIFVSKLGPKDREQMRSEIEKQEVYEKVWHFAETKAREDMLQPTENVVIDWG
ncbi:hen1 methyltransferase [Brevipalpus obovatus]|uniref:hen1 methyltransferase n=1 Tax=Brevipalpus obovatus TaxID=246614 RepID=UPI003D9E2E33